METLDTPQLRVASDYFNDDEMAAFKKPKAKKKKIRKKILKVVCYLFIIKILDTDWSSSP
jgi:hypothetical protein